ncbi:MAG: 50S ribosomal protein L15e [Nanoarchaeota archaeon]|nr:50S ribosomal protein L15e [Nanoarchaeota archaeon]MBU4351891.1 50S ribosomal protein L15e [Nanoarchaeota archaeon]MBU4456765.1 50S ribosomal protein L15e [Nanoarchaeota archaeon]MCG2719656.1 50S ribosomal protein L15e [Nanoarchaeota archaeon]
MALYKYLKDLWKQPKKNLGDLWKQRLIQWRKEPVIVTVDRPLRLDRARNLGYQAKKGFIIVRIKIGKGGRQREQQKKKRKPKNSRRVKIVEKNYKAIAEQRCQRKFTNLEVLNSYFVGKDGKYYWFEVIMVDPSHPIIKGDLKMSWICEKQHKKRAMRGLTSAGKKSRGLRHKGKGAEKLRPSKSANRAKRVRKHGHKQRLHLLKR